MGIFHKLFGKSAEPTVSAETKPQQNQTPSKKEDELLEQFSGIAIDKQLNFEEIIGKIE